MGIDFLKKWGRLYQGEEIILWIRKQVKESETNDVAYNLSLND